MNNMMNKYFEKWIEDFCKSRKHIQLSVGISDGGVHKTFLYTSDGKTENKKMSYEIGSITKVVTGLLVAKAINESKISLNDRIDKYIDFKNKNDHYPTIKSLVSHTSGCSDSFVVFDEEIQKNEAQLNPFNGYSKKEMIDLFEQQSFDEKSSPEYSNLGSSMIGLLLEKIYDTPYNDLVMNFLKSIGLNNTQVELPNNLLHGYTDDLDCGNWIWPKDNPFNSAGALYSNVEDMLKLGDLYCSDEEDIFKISKKSIVTIHEIPKIEMGLFWGKYADYDIITHSGSTGCFSSIIVVDLKNKRTIVMLSNYLDDDDLGIAFEQLRKAQLL